MLYFLWQVDVDQKYNFEKSKEKKIERNPKNLLYIGILLDAV